MVPLAVAGIAGPIIFTLLVILQSLLQPDYGQVAMPISALAAWPYGWLQNLNFCVFGLLLIAFTIGLHRGVRVGRWAFVAPALLIMSGIGLVLAGVFPMTRDASGALIEPVGHAVSSCMVFLGAGIGLIVMSRRMAKDHQWKSIASYTRACGIIIVVLFPIMGGLAVPADGPLHPWFGLLQRVVLAVWFPCLVGLAMKLLHITRLTGQPV